MRSIIKNRVYDSSAGRASVMLGINHQNLTMSIHVVGSDLISSIEP